MSASASASALRPAEAPSHPGLNLGAGHGEAHGRAETLVFGFWVFMMSDLVLFGVIFAVYVTMLGATAGGPGPRELFELGPVFVETLVLLGSSFTFGLAAVAMKNRRGAGPVLGWLGVTLALGLAFLVMEWHDFRSMFDKGGYPSRSGWLSAFFALVPLHGLHVAGACLWLVAIAGQVLVHGVDDDVKTGVLRLGILWHFLDLVWIGIFSIVYLGGLA